MLPRIGDSPVPGKIFYGGRGIDYPKNDRGMLSPNRWLNPPPALAPNYGSANGLCISGAVRGVLRAASDCVTG